jgi:hypothetical protein
MYFHYVIDEQNNESFLELSCKPEEPPFALLVVNDTTRSAEMHFAVDGKIVKIPLEEFEEGLQHAKELFKLT